LKSNKCIVLSVLVEGVLNRIAIYLIKQALFNTCILKFKNAGFLIFFRVEHSLAKQENNFRN